MAGTEIKMPQLGESVVEGTISKWLKKEGDTIGEDELLVEISTDKVDSEVPSSAGGVLQQILVPEGETVSVGTPIAVIGAAGGEGAEEAEPAEQSEPDTLQVPPSEGSDEAAPPQEEATEQAQTDAAASAEEHPKDEPAYEPQQPDTPAKQDAPAPSHSESADPADGTRREARDADHYEPARQDSASGDGDSWRAGS